MRRGTLAGGALLGLAGLVALGPWGAGAGMAGPLAQAAAKGRAAAAGPRMDLDAILASEPAVGELPPPPELAARRLEAARARLDAAAVAYELGEATIDRMLAAVRDYFRARSATADAEGRRAAADEQARVLRSLVRRERVRGANGVGARLALAEAEAYLAEAEAELGKLRADKPPAKPDR